MSWLINHSKGRRHKQEKVIETGQIKPDCSPNYEQMAVIASMLRRRRRVSHVDDVSRRRCTGSTRWLRRCRRYCGSTRSRPSRTCAPCRRARCSLCEQAASKSDQGVECASKFAMIAKTGQVEYDIIVKSERQSQQLPPGALRPGPSYADAPRELTLFSACLCP